MAHPSRPQARVGLPSSPAPRSRSLTARAPRPDVPSRPASAAGQRSRVDSAVAPLPPLPPNLKPQRFFADIPSSYYGSPRRPEVKRIARIPPPPIPVDLAPTPFSNPSDGNTPSDFLGQRKGSNASVASLGSASSRSSATSAASSTFDSKSPLSSASSTTSLEDEAYVAYVPKDVPPPVPTNSLEGFGTALWSRVAVVAENLTVSVNKAIETYADPPTPIGQESRLTRAMKEYHLTKARDPSDLPDWLFEDRDRGVLGRLKIANATPDDLSRPSSTATSLPPITDPLPTSDRLPSPWETDIRERKTVSRMPSMLNAQQPSRAGTRVRFVQQVHPRQYPGVVVDEGSVIGTAKGTPSATPISQLPAPREVQTILPPQAQVPQVNKVRLPNVDIRGKRPSARGLPSGVRPNRRSD
ncbi:unnamed protein product [Somion occarium]|uniref:Uncharacterized protein n=1 Tax=Somion occarium TaxID=3059160 RepID=A0ABP1DAG9_9APHY